MAKLHTDKEKYGVSVAARIDPELAHQIADRADRLGLSFARLVGILIARGFKPQEPIVVENHDKLDELERSYDQLADEYISLQTRDTANREAIAQFVQSLFPVAQEALTQIEHFKSIRDGILAQQSGD